MASLFLFPPHPSPPLTMSFIQQNLIPSHSGISIRRLGVRDIGTITKHILDNKTRVLGLSLGLSPKDGKVDVVAFATGTHIFQVSLGQTTPGSCGDNLAQLLSSVRFQLAAFDMARVALHLHKQCGLRVRGVDLSTLFSVSTAAPDTPAELVSTRASSNANRHRIHSLWYNDEPKNVCLRAWISAL